MRATRYKKALLVVIALLSLGGIVFIRTQPAFAAAAQCNHPGPDVKTYFGECGSRNDTYPAASGNFEDGHCYTLTSTAQFGPVYFDASCDVAPFTSSSTASATKSQCEQAPTTPGCGSAFSDGAPCKGGDYCGFVDKYINPVLNFLAIGFGLIVTITVVVSGIQYITSGGNPQAIGAAKKRIFNAVLSLLLFIFMWALLQWLVPGGLF